MWAINWRSCDTHLGFCKVLALGIKDAVISSRYFLSYYPAYVSDTYTHFSRLPPEAGFKGAASPFGGGWGLPTFSFFSRLRRREKIKKVFWGHPETPSGDRVPCTPAEVGEIEHVCSIVRYVCRGVLGLYNGKWTYNGRGRCAYVR